jgi:hypothetical protein
MIMSFAHASLAKPYSVLPDRANPAVYVNTELSADPLSLPPGTDSKVSATVIPGGLLTFDALACGYPS